MSSWFWPIGLCICFYVVFVAVTLQYIWKWGSIMPSPLFFWLRIVFEYSGFCVALYKFQDSFPFLWSMSLVFRYWLQEIGRSRQVVLTLLNSIHSPYSWTLYLSIYLSSWISLVVFDGFCYRDASYFGWLIPKNFSAIINEIFLGSWRGPFFS